MPKTIHRPEYSLLRELVREERVRAGVTQADLSARLNRSQSFVSDVERGVRRLDVIELRDMCQVLGSNFLEVVAEFEKRTRRDLGGLAPSRRAGKVAAKGR